MPFSLLKRIKNQVVGKSHQIMDEAEDPVIVIEQAIRELEDNLKNSVTVLAEAKGRSVQAERALENTKTAIAEQEKKSDLVIQMVDGGKLSPENAEVAAQKIQFEMERLNGLLVSQEENATRYKTQEISYEKRVNDQKTKLQTLRSELTTIKADHQIGKAALDMEEKMSKFDSNSAMSAVERAKKNIANNKHKADALAGLNAEPVSASAEVDKILADAAKASGGSALDALRKAKK